MKLNEAQGGWHFLAQGPLLFSHAESPSAARHFLSQILAPFLLAKSDSLSLYFNGEDEWKFIAQYRYQVDLLNSSSDCGQQLWT